MLIPNNIIIPILILTRHSTFIIIICSIRNVDAYTKTKKNIHYSQKYYNFINVVFKIKDYYGFLSVIILCGVKPVITNFTHPMSGKKNNKLYAPSNYTARYYTIYTQSLNFKMHFILFLFIILNCITIIFTVSGIIH